MVDQRTTNAPHFIRESNSTVTNQLDTDNNENLEELCVIWADSNVNKTDDCLDTVSKLRSIVDLLQIFDNIDECLSSIDSNTREQRIFLIVSGEFGQSLVPRIHHLSRIVSIYIFCFDRIKHEHWANEYKPKVRGAFTDKDLLCAKLTSDVRIQLRTFLPMSILNENAKQRSIKDLDKDSVMFMWFQLLIQILIHMKHNDNAKNEMIHLCRKQNKNNLAVLKQIDEFCLDYNTDRATEWYSKDIFLYRLLNRALRTENFDMIYKFRFFITDLHFQLEKLYRQYTEILPKSSITVYRGQFMPINDIKALENNINGFISVNTFFSTSQSYITAYGFIQGGSDEVPGVIFTIQIGDNINDQCFAFLNDSSIMTQEEEVLFTIGTVFQIVEIEKVTSTIWAVELTLQSKDNVELKELMHSFQEEIGETPTLLNLGNILFYIGEYDRVEKYNNILLEQLSSEDDKDGISLVYNNIGDVYVNKGKYSMASDYYEKSLSLALNLQPNPHPYLASIYNSIGLLNDRTGKYNEAITNLEKARDIKLIYVPSNHLFMTSTYNNVAMVYKHKADYQTSLENYHQALEIQCQSLPHLHPNLASTYNNIALVNSQLNHYDEALKNYTKALEIESKSLPSNHHKIATTYNNIALLYVNLQNHSEAIKHYEKALKIFLNIFEHDHPTIGAMYYNLGDLCYKTSDYDQAIKYFEQSYFHSGFVSSWGSFVLSALSFQSHFSASGSSSPPNLPLWPPSVISSLYL